MSLLKSMISEIAVPGSSGTDAFVSTSGSLFKGGHLNSKNPNKKHKGIFVHRVHPITMPRLAEAMGISTDETKFNAADVISKLDAAEKKANANQDTTTFGLEDENGNIVKVHVRQEQAADFEKALGALLSGQNEGDDDHNSAIEIAEVLFELRNKFDIIDVDWGTIPADEEEEQEVEGMPPEGETNPDELGAEPGITDPNAMGGEDADVKSALSQVIDLLKSQAEAQKAEADARAAEAKAREAEAAAKAAESKIKQEEEILDMEAYNKKKVDEKKEAKRLAQLAKFKHETAKEAESILQQDANGQAPSVDIERTGVQMQGVEQEERQVVSPRELAAAIFRQLQSK